MFLKKVKIKNYRQLKNIELDMQDSLTVLAGPNNSGKTTLISVLKGMFCDKKLSFNYSDIPVNLSLAWLEKILPIFQQIMIEFNKEEGIREIINKISVDDRFIDDYIMDSFQAQIQVDYNPECDDIQYFADYLMDLDDTKHSFYFIYTYELSISSFEKGLNEHYDRMSVRFRDIDDPEGAEKEIKNSSIISLDNTIRNISKTSGGHIGKLQLEMDVDEHDVEEFIQRITRAKYDIDGLLLNEDSQGLGFSNLIYLHMKLEEFYKSIDNNKVNVFFIEEPESHMHPQMQNVFIRFLKNYYVDKKMQGLITTHSNEIAKMVGLDSLRVIRQTGKSKSELFNLCEFRNSIKGEKVGNVDEESEFLLENFFDWFFEIGYSELIFADRVILYEGDSERLYIRKLIKLPEFSDLADSYIAFIQVGGAYAHNYLPILKMLKIKTLIITDLDYNKNAVSMDEVKSEDSKSTNATINYCYRLVHSDRGEKYSPNIKELYDFQTKGENILYNGLVYLTFQDEKSTARTLEEAMLNKLLKVDVFHTIKRSDWKEKRKANKLTFSISNNKENEKDSKYSIHKIVEATSNKKTDFMYSVILSGNEKEMLPDYIEKGLLWLAK